MSKENRKGYEFTDKTKKKAEKDAGGISPTGQPLVKPEHHHLLPVAEAKKRGIPPAVVRQPQNDVPVTHQEHVQIHRELRKKPPEEKEEYLSAIAQWLLSLFGK